jgi:osmotically-inducible protein OsmY
VDDASDGAELGVADSRSERGPKQYVVEHIRDALAHDRRVAQLDVQVKVVGDRIFVKGTVPAAARREAITTVLQEMFGDDADIHNEVTVLTPTERPEPEHL